jgi:hypothetical protein
VSLRDKILKSKAERAKAEESKGATFFSAAAEGKPTHRAPDQQQSQQDGPELQTEIPPPLSPLTKPDARQEFLPPEEGRPAHFRKPHNRTFFETGHTDPLYQLSTHRRWADAQTVDAAIAAKRATQERRAFSGMDFLLSILAIGSGRE